MRNKKESLEERCIDEEGVPKYRKILMRSSYCLASQFKCVGSQQKILDQSEIVKNGLNCPYFGHLVFDLGEHIYALNCKNEKKESGKEKK